ncbi:DMT family transporter [Acetobacter conturbans]|uniref:EamA family transporter n=1 Tax=Acetobacter conturbans TaxID=1737472 RepID=A0ABX0JZC7_9PROT|nr:DMT family transporter [Acetobacter conturbans]NHN88688.1 EamA family transporter [Acetobacter conturbans]
MIPRKEPDVRAVLIMTALCAIWGVQQAAIKSVADDMTPILQIAVRSGMAVLLIVALLLWQRQLHKLREVPLPAALGIGGLFAMEFLFAGEGLHFTSAAHISIFLYTAPIFIALGMHWKLPEERMSPLQWSGIGLAFLGVAVSFLGKASPTTAQDFPLGWVGDLLGILGGVTWAAATMLIRFSPLAYAPATVTLFWQLVGACGLLSLATIILGQTDVHYTPALVADLSFQVIVISFASYLAWFGLLRIYLASRLGVLAFLTPLFGITSGVVFLHEPLDPAFILGAVMIMGGIMMVNGQTLLKRRFRTA